MPLASRPRAQQKVELFTGSQGCVQPDRKLELSRPKPDVPATMVGRGPPQVPIFSFALSNHTNPAKAVKSSHATLGKKVLSPPSV